MSLMIERGEGELHTVDIGPPVVDNVLVLVGDKGFLVPPLEDVDTVLVHCQPQVLGQGAGVALHHFKDR